MSEGRMDTLTKYWVYSGKDFNYLFLQPNNNFGEEWKQVYLAAPVDAVLAAKDAELARLTTIAEEQRLREYKLVEVLETTKREVAAMKERIAVLETAPDRIKNEIF